MNKPIPYDGAQKEYFDNYKKPDGWILGGSPSRIDINQIAQLLEGETLFIKQADGYLDKNGNPEKFPRKLRKRFRLARKKV
jgi:hypothetical protein